MGEGTLSRERLYEVVHVHSKNRISWGIMCFAQRYGVIFCLSV